MRNRLRRECASGSLLLLGKVLEDEKQVSSYLLREGDTTNAKELADVGVVPFEFKVVRLAASAPYVPEFTSKSPSIELASIQPNFAGRCRKFNWSCETFRLNRYARSKCSRLATALRVCSSRRKERKAKH